MFDLKQNVTWHGYPATIYGKTYSRERLYAIKLGDGRSYNDIPERQLVAADNVTGNVTIRMRNVPWDQALDTILQAKKLGMVRRGNIIRVAEMADLVYHSLVLLAAHDLSWEEVEAELEKRHKQ